MPLNVALEMRFTKHSDSPLCPAFGAEVRGKANNRLTPLPVRQGGTMQ